LERHILDKFLLVLVTLFLKNPANLLRFGLPLLKGYVAAGDFTPKDRLKRAALGSLRSYLIMAVLGGLFVLYLLATGKMGT
jgi:hypothetical protein